MAVLSAICLAIALLVPLRDDRRGRRATLMGAAPFRAVFPAAEIGSNEPAPVGPRKNAFSALAFRAFGATFGTGRRAAEEQAAPAPGDDVAIASRSDDWIAVDDDRAFADELVRAERDVTIEPTANDGEPSADETEPAAHGIERTENGIGRTENAATAATHEAEATAAERERAKNGASPITNDEKPETDDGMSPTSGSGPPEHDARLIDPYASFEALPAVDEGTNAPADERIVVRSGGAGPFDRSRPPLTRLPLRPVRAAVTWPLDLPGGATWSYDDRRNFLRGCVERPDPSVHSALRAAWREEDAAGRLLALKALAKSSEFVARDTFADALRSGNDDERAFAVDVFADRGDGAALVDALSDRLEAIAARAALAIVGSGTRADFEAALEPLVDRTRLDAILGLLTAVFA